MSEKLIEVDPANLAEPFVYGVTPVDDGFNISDYDHYALNVLDQAADELGFIKSPFFVSTSRALAIPKSFAADEEVGYGNFYNLAFEGQLQCYSKVLIGKIIGGSSVRALCLAFDKVTLLPHMDRLHEDKLLYTPVLAVDSIDKTV